VTERDLVELVHDELDRVVGGDSLQQDRVGDAASEVVVDA
jgi:hypothetical protein